jgi:DNA polymerase-3 subunit delta
VPAFKPAYLIHGDDHGRVAERRGSLRRVAEDASGAGGVELFEGDGAAPGDVALALTR